MTTPPRTVAQRREALEARDRRRKALEAAWAAVGPELDEITDLGIRLRDELDRAGWATHGFTTTEDHTGPLVFVTDEPTAAEGEELDRLCLDFARRHDVEAGWEHDPGGPIMACTST